MKMIGLTGQSGSGKTTVSSFFLDGGFEIINADLVAREVMEKGEVCLEETVRAFGEEILNDDGTLNRKHLAEIVFSDWQKLKKLNSITHPHINKRVSEKAEALRKCGAEYVLLDAPTLFESGEDKLCDAIVSVTAKVELRAKRIIERDKINNDMVMKRFSSQHSVKFFKEHSDYIIENNGSREELEEQAKDIIRQIKEKA